MLHQWSQGSRIEYARPGAYGFAESQHKEPVLVAHGCVWHVQDGLLVLSDRDRLLKLFVFLSKMGIDTTTASRAVEQWRAVLIQMI